MTEVNEILAKYDADSYEPCEGINIGKCKVIIFTDTLLINKE
jgi:hypothetical protein